MLLFVFVPDESKVNDKSDGCEQQTDGMRPIKHITRNIVHLFLIDVRKAVSAYRGVVFVGLSASLTRVQQWMWLRRHGQ